MIYLQRIVFSIIFLILTIGTANAVIIEKNSENQITGFSNVSVGSQLFNVSFEYGTCAEVFNGCDSLDDFDFQSVSAAIAGSQAILDALTTTNTFGDPELIYDGSDFALCDQLDISCTDFQTPFRSLTDEFGNLVEYDAAAIVLLSLPQVVPGFFPSNDPNVFLSWQEVPIPPTVGFYVFSLLLLFLSKSRWA